MFQDLIFFQDSDMSSYIGFQCFKISGLFQDLASMNKTLSISVGLNSHASCLSHTNCLSGQRESESQHKNNGTLSLSVSRHGKLGRRTKPTLILAIERGDIDPHNLDGAYLFGKTVQLFPGYEGDGTPKARTNVIARLRKKLRNHVFDGTVSGRRKRRAVGELFTLRSVFLLALPIPILCLLPSPMFQS